MAKIRHLLPMLAMLILGAAPSLAYDWYDLEELPPTGSTCIEEGPYAGCWVDGIQMTFPNDDMASLYQDPGKAIGSIRDEIPSPLAVQSDAALSDIAWDGVSIWANGGTNATMYEISPVDGEILRQIDVSRGGIRGLAWDGSSLWVSFFNRFEFCELDAAALAMEFIDFSTVPCIAVAAAPVGLGYDGLAYDTRNGTLWASSQLQIVNIDPADGFIDAIIPTPVVDPRGLTFDGRFVWVSHQRTGNNLVYKINTQTGVPSSEFISPPISTQGIAFNGDDLWVGGQDEALFLVDIGSAPTFANDVQRMYVAYYGRPSDPEGQVYWEERLEFDEGGDLEAMIDAFGTSAEFTDRYAGLPDEDLINGLFMQMFGRVAEAEGLEFYIDLLNGTNNSGMNEELDMSTLAEIALDIALGASDEVEPDLSTLANRLRVANYFTEVVEEVNFDYGPDNIDAASAILADVTADDATITSAMAEVDDLLRP